MKICLVSDYLVGYHQNWSGAEMVCQQLSQSLEKENDEVFFLTTKSTKQNKKNQGRIYPVPTLADAPKNFKKIGAPFYLILSVASCLFIFFRKKPDVVNLLHSNYLFVPAMIAAKILRIKTVFTFLDYYLICSRGNFVLPSGKICDQKEGRACLGCVSYARYFERTLTRFFSKRLDGIITFTETSKKRLISQGFSKEKIAVIYTYSINSEFKKKKKKAKTQTVLIVASFHEHKGLHVVLKSWPKVLSSFPKAKLTIVGSGNAEDKDRIEKLAAELRIAKSLIFMGQKDNEEVLDLILKHEIVVVPEQWPSEFGPLALVEAMALGRPVVASRIGSAPDFIKDGGNGLLADYDQPEDFSKNIIKLFKNEKRTEAMGESARKSCQFLFEGDQGRQTHKFYQELIQ
ncbi:MAG: glycosyltransferase family 4 protein [bacterium]|nr:glycosyltransferase family 4 protein [bacterium]